jgi:nicotinamidase-related amidase
MAQQSSNTNRPKLSEKGLLTPDNCVVALIDHQGQMLFGTGNFDRQGIINNTVAFGKATRVFDVPVVLSTVETKSFSGNMWPQLRAVFPGRETIERSSMNSWDDKNFVAAMKRVVQVGAKPVTSMQVMLEWQRDWADRRTYDAVMDIVKNHYGAYGIGVEYAYTMVHGAPATKLPEYTVPAAVATAAHK